MQNQTRKRYHKDNAPSDDIITLINLVRQNPALYNYKLHPNQRRRSDVLNGWAEIAAQIGHKYPVEECRRKWKNLRDTYHQYRLRKPKYIEGRLSKWRYAKELEFLSNVYQPKLKSQRNLHCDTTVENSLLSNIKSSEDDDVMVDEDDMDDDHKANNGMNHHDPSQMLVSDETETFILSAYEESVNGDVVTTIDNHPQNHDHIHHQHTHGDSLHIELTPVIENDEDEDVENGTNVHDVGDIVKNETNSSLDDDGTTGADVYEEVCFYEEADHPTNVDCRIDITNSSADSTSIKKFHYLDTSDFCASTINSNASISRSSQFTNNVLSGSRNNNSVKLKNLTLIASAPITAPLQNRTITVAGANKTINSDDEIQTSLTGVTDVTDTHLSHCSAKSLSPIVHKNNCVETSVGTIVSTTPSFSTPTILHLPNLSSAASICSSSSTFSNSNQTTPFCTFTTPTEEISGRDELDLFFDFLKKKIQCFSKKEITHIQVEFLNCVLRREANLPKD